MKSNASPTIIWASLVKSLPGVGEAQQSDPEHFDKRIGFSLAAPFSELAK